MSKKASTIQLSIRVRPLLADIEDDLSWEIDRQHKTIYSLTQNQNLIAKNQ